MTINDRIRSIRTELGLTQTEFGQRIGVSQNHLTGLETNKRNVTERIEKLICSEFNVNAHWLRTGDGNMFADDDASTFARLAEEYHFSDLEKAFFAEYIKLPPAQRTVMNDYLGSVVAAVNQTRAAQQQIISASAAQPETAENPIEAELEAYRQELEAEEKGQISYQSDAQSGA